MTLRSSGAGAAALGALLLAAPAALANGRFPNAGQVVVDPSDKTHLVVRATYGIVDSHDNGESWRWVCESAVGYGGFEDPMMGITKDGTILAGIFEGLAISRDSGCQWDFAGGPLDKRFAIDLAVEPMNPENVVLAVSNSVGGSKFLTQVWQSSDNAKTFSQAGVDLPDNFLGITLEVAPSDPTRLYVSGRYGGTDDFAGAVQRSKDRGKTWDKMLIPGSDDQNPPYIGGVDPHDPDRIYVRLDRAVDDKLMVSKDGGQNWESPITITGNMLGFALSPDGATVAVAGDTAGIWTAPADTLSFTKVSSVAARCLTWTSEGLYACANVFVDGFTVGLSTNAGKTFTPVMLLQKLCGPKVCGAETSVGKTCGDAWGATQLALGGADGGAICEPDGGSSGSSSGGGGGDMSSSGGGTSCSCSAAGGAAGSLLPALALASIGALRARRRRGASRRPRA